MQPQENNNSNSAYPSLPNQNSFELPKVDKPNEEETSKMIENGASALKTGFQYIGWGAQQLAQKAEEHKVMEKMKEGIIQAK